MMTEPEIRAALRKWIVQKNGKIKAEDLNDQTPIMQQRILASIHLLDLILYLENLTGRPINVKSLKKGVFRDIDSIYRNFFL